MREDSSKKPVPTVLVGTGTDASLATIESSKTLFTRMKFNNMPSTEEIIARDARDPTGIIAGAGKMLLATPGVQEAVAAIQDPPNKANVFSAIPTRVQEVISQPQRHTPRPFLLVPDGANAAIDRRQTNEIKNPGGPNASKTPTERKPEPTPRPQLPATAPTPTRTSTL